MTFLLYEKTTIGRYEIAFSTCSCQLRKTPLFAGLLLLLRFLEYFPLAGDRIKLLILKLALYFLLILAREVHRIRLGRLQLDEVVLRHM